MKFYSLLFIWFFSLASLIAHTQVVELDIPETYKKMKNPFTGDTKAISKGARVYKKVCWTCHGDGGKGTGPQAAELETKPSNYNDPKVVSLTDGEMYYWIMHGGRDMQAFKETLTEDQVWQVITYIRRLQKTRSK